MLGKSPDGQRYGGRLAVPFKGKGNKVVFMSFDPAIRLGGTWVESGDGTKTCAGCCAVHLTNHRLGIHGEVEPAPVLVASPDFTQVPRQPAACHFRSPVASDILRLTLSLSLADPFFPQGNFTSHGLKAGSSRIGV